MSEKMLSVVERIASTRPRLSAQPRPARVPLSDSQQRLWFIDRLEGTSTEYNVSMAVRLRGELDPSVLQRALDTVVERHESLRTRFVEIEGEPVQVIEPAVSLVIEEDDWRGLSDEEQRESLGAAMRREADRPFDLGSGPLLRVRLLRLGESDHVLLRTLHHIIDDAWSAAIFVRECIVLYDAYRDGRANPLPPLTVQYADFALWQHQLLAGARDAKLAYWRTQLAELPERLTLQTDRARPERPAFEPGFYETAIPAGLTAALKRFSADHQATVYMSLLAALAVLLHRYTGDEDLAIGAPIANRHDPQLEGVIGFFVNTLVMRVRPTPHMTFEALLAQVRRTTLDAYRHQDVPFQRLVEELAPRRRAGETPLFQVALAMQNVPSTSLDIKGLTVERFSLGGVSALADLDLYVVEAAGCLEVSWVYKKALFDSWRIEQMARHYHRLLESVLTGATRAIAALPILDEEDRRLNGRAAAVRALPAQTIAALFEAQAERTPDATAVVYGSQNVSYAGLNTRSNRLAHALIARGVGPEDAVGVVADRSADLVVALLGVVKAGAAYLPLDLEYPAARLQQILRDAAPVAVLHADHPPTSWSIELPLLRIGGDPSEVVSPSHNPRDVERRAALRGAHPAYVIYTSGSTGTPKGVAVPHDALLNHMSWMADQYPLTQDDRVLQKTPLTFDASVWEFFAPLLAGACLVVAPPQAHREPETLVDLAARHQVTVLQVVPSVLSELMQLPEFVRGRSLRRLFCGGEALDRDLAARFLSASSATLHNLYGPTEACIDATAFDCVDPAGLRSVPIGTAIWNTSLRVLDECLEPVPVGVPGELYIAGAGLARGYVGQEALTAARFVADRHGAPGSRAYRTGDVVVWRPDGNLTYLGRNDQQVKLRGFRVEMGDIVAGLRRDPQVQDAVVTLHDHGGDARLLAYVIPHRESFDVDTGRTAHLHAWRELYERQEELPSSGGGDFDLVGWNSSYTQQPLPFEEMRAWVDETVSVLRSFEARRVLEIGCGTGLLLTRLAGACERYIGTDFSHSIVTQLQQSLRDRADLGGVELRVARAHELSWLADRSVDLVILNSTVQYFPDVSYLLTVLAEAVRVTRDGGHVFVGDVRSLPLLEAFHTSVQVYRAPASLSCAEVQRRVARALRDEKELVLAPNLFDDLVTGWSRVASARVTPKTGAYDNELSRFRYNVTLHVGPDRKSAAPPAQWVMWDVEGRWRAEVSRHLEADPAAAIGVRGILDRRAAGAALAVRALRDAPRANVERVRRASVEATGEDVQQILDVARDCGVAVDWRGLGSDAAYDVVFRPGWQTAPPHAALLPEAYEKHGNNPARRLCEVALEQALRERLRQTLPEYMVPSVVTVLSAWPLTPHGKLDRRALPVPAVESSTTSRPPTTDDEKTLCELFATVLGVERVGLDDDFFAMGGHSLMATRLASQVRARLGKSFPIRTLFESPTVATLGPRLSTVADERPHVRPMPRPGRIPLSYAQQGLWIRDRLQGSTSEYNIPTTLRLRGSLDVGALQRALQVLVGRHESLRTYFEEHDGEPYQVIGPVPLLSVPFEDLSNLSPADREAQIAAAIGQERDQPFDLARGPVTRSRLLRIGDRDHLLLRSTHHIATDGWSEAVVNRELMLLYGAFLAEQRSPLAPLPLQYADFALWQRRTLDDTALATALTYWRTQLQGIPEQLELPTDRPRPLRPTFETGRHSVVVPSEQGKALYACSRAHGTTLYMTLLAAFGVVLARHSGQDDLVVGTPIANRQDRQLEEVVGFFVNALAMRLRVRPDMPFQTLLADVRQTTLEAYQHQDVPFERVVREVAPTRSSNTPPVFQVFFAMQNAPWVEPRLEGIDVQPFGGDHSRARFDLELHAVEGPQNQVRLEWRFDRQLFDSWRIEQMAAQLVRVLAIVGADPGRVIRDIDLLGGDDRQQILREWNATAHELPNLSASALFEAQADRTPEAVALIHGDQHLTFGRLNARANRLAHDLLGRGVKPETLVGVALGRSPDLVCALLAVLKAGAAYLPIDHRYPPSRIAFMLADSSPAWVMTTQDIAHRLPEQCHALILDAAEVSAAIASRPDHNPSSAGARTAESLAHPAYVLYTSGSTGQPKGVIGVQAGLVNRLRWWGDMYRYPDRGPTLSKSTISFIDGTTELLGPLTHGGSVVLASDDAARDPAALRALIARHRIGLLTAIPTLIRAMLAEEESADDVTSCSVWISSGEELTKADLDAFADALPNARLLNFYGSSEASGDSLWATSDDAESVIGRPLWNTAVYLLDPDGGPVPIGAAGELHIAGTGLARGYLNRPGLTASRFVPDPFGPPGARMYQTGDVGRWRRDGQVEFLGRIDRQVKIRGHRVELGEIEAALRKIANVKEAVATIHGDERHAGRLVSYVVPRHGQSIDCEEVLHTLRASLPHYMVPSTVITLDRLPLTPSGKLDRRSLPAPDLTSERPSTTAPRTEKEQVLCHLFAEALGVEQVGIDDDFFELGGHSLIATRLANLIRKRLNVRLTIGGVFDAPTVRELSASLSPVDGDAPGVRQQWSPS